MKAAGVNLRAMRIAALSPREEEAMTDPWDADSDDDGMSDGYEADN